MNSILGLPHREDHLARWRCHGKALLDLASWVIHTPRLDCGTPIDQVPIEASHQNRNDAP